MLEQLPLVETRPIRDRFVKGASSVEVVAQNVRRITFFAVQRCAFDSRMERAIVARFIMADKDIMSVRDFIEMEMRPTVFAARPPLMSVVRDH